MSEKNNVIFGDSYEYLMNKKGVFDLAITSPPYNIGKEYEEKRSLTEYKIWIKPFIQYMYESLKPNGQICFQVGNYVNKGRVYPLDCILFDMFLEFGFIPRGRIIWSFGHGLHCKNRFSGRHETILWFTKTDEYTFNIDPVRIPSKYPNKKHFKGKNKGELSGNPLGKNPSDVWEITNIKHNHPEKTEHPCQFPEELVKRLILSMTNPGDHVIDPFCGSGTVGKVANDIGRFFTIIDSNEKYIKISKQRIKSTK